MIARDIVAQKVMPDEVNGKTERRDVSIKKKTVSRISPQRWLSGPRKVVSKKKDRKKARKKSQFDPHFERAKGKPTRGEKGPPPRT